ncbi:MAG: cell division protein CrgA [Pseudonocardia sp.]|uniref:cell division protein CrgA n=1 Tax=unclassified Pseudonocardia TaxID=2619320 RepID=UPI00086C5983|nr:MULTISPECIES: cell division protein CrgA [unclassified Pseudonocardia]MBN9109823.1 cell division protein CrgA [Pseudonocardia sp.]ODU13194.1 MAG: cell division protein CrgA [Pseudonocardia sp. SCN 72-51]ODV09220.1 MAG: cell division protein CrgA [Pseudonocardia sp. SCN 73-27]
MPKSKVRKKAAAYTPPAQRSAVKEAGPTSPVYVVVMLGLMLIGLAWLVVNYIAGDKIALFTALGSWNFLIGFSLIVVGLLMTMRWR